ncbi:hypothetical protein, partial [Escherichia coli]|uniref:hypothetical protein n=1 Tax=Escherichia coli TaxID=562 RepID=UPI000D0A8E41
FIKSPVLCCGEDITFNQVAKFTVPLHGSFHYLKNNSLKYRICNTEKTQNHTLNKNLIIKQICMDKLQDEI